MAGRCDEACRNSDRLFRCLLLVVPIAGCSSETADPVGELSPSRVAEIRASIERVGGNLICNGENQPVEIDFLASRASVDPEVWQMVLSCPTLEVLRIRAGQISPQDLRGLLALSQLRQLHLQDAAISDALIADLVQRLPQLQHISLRNTPEITDQGVSRLATLPKLSHLTLIEQQITGEAIRALAQMEHLSMLDLRMCHAIGADDLAALAAAPRLKELKLGGRAVDDSMLAAAARLPHLRSLTIEDAPIGNDGLLQLSTGKSAAEIENLAFARCSGLTDNVCTHLGSFPQLQRLILRDVPVTGGFLQQLAAPDQLQWLSLSQTYLTPDAFDALVPCVSLKRLDLSGTWLSLEMTQKLAGLESLEFLDLSECGLSDEIVAPLMALKGLKTLVVDGNPDLRSDVVTRMGSP
jgi:hypothetical protein